MDGAAGFEAFEAFEGGVPEGGGIEPAPDSVLGLLALALAPVPEPLEGALPLLPVPLGGALLATLGLGSSTPDADDVLAGSDGAGPDEAFIMGSSDVSLSNVSSFLISI